MADIRIHGKMNENTQILRVLELYSGIGGFHYALKDSDLKVEIVAAIDINTNANQVYMHNFPSTPIFQRNIQAINSKHFECFMPDLVWMSPPCQPFTRNGLKKDKMDHRTDSFLNILENLKLIRKKPKFILLENVKGFETSETHDLLTQTLNDCGYELNEYLLCPRQFGIPNSRLRYYMIAKLSEESVIPTRTSVINHTLNHSGEQIRHRNISEFLEDEFSDEFLIPDRILGKYAQAMDIVTSANDHSCCFTKSYGHYATGTGSVLRTNEMIDMEAVFLHEYQHENEKLNALKALQLRYFTPREVANLMGFPKTFGK
uniref:DNA methyltransferase 2 n=1 Tax=Strigamia maritima TaxID=126957 RepID=T1ITE8_STRMM